MMTEKRMIIYLLAFGIGLLLMNRVQNLWQLDMKMHAMTSLNKDDESFNPNIVIVVNYFNNEEQKPFKSREPSSDNLMFWGKKGEEDDINQKADDQKFGEENGAHKGDNMVDQFSGDDDLDEEFDELNNIIQIDDTISQKRPNLWYLTRYEDIVRPNMNIDEAWTEGASGKGVVVSIVDDGLEWNHPDLIENYDPLASIDLDDNDDDPSPRYDYTNTNKQGTQCAGIVAGKANNSVCGKGIAYNAKIGGIRVIDTFLNDTLEAAAFSFNNDHIDIYSMSWGPNDNGATVDGPGPFGSEALKKGAELGRNGKGSIYVWASGSGGRYKDNCNCDGYITSIYTLPIGTATEYGMFPWYGEACSSSFATTLGSGSSDETYKGDTKVITPNLHGKCADTFTGSSTSAPVASAILALALEINPDLTWRDVQHLVVRSTKPQGVLEANDWTMNGAGLYFSHYFGFGLMDAGNLVRMAKTWKTVPKQIYCNSSKKNPMDLIEGEEVYSMDASNCGHIKHIEHVQLVIDLSSESRRGDLSVSLWSAYGTVSNLLTKRPYDTIRTGLSAFEKWPLMSVHFWGEAVASNDNIWKLIIHNDSFQPAVLNSWHLRFYGTTEDPQPE